MTALLGALVSCLLAQGAGRPAVPDHVTVPLIVEGNRPFIELTLEGPKGRRTARFLVDSGGGAFGMTETLVRDLGLTWGTPFTEEGHQIAVLTSAPKAFVGAFPLALNPERVGVDLGVQSILPDAAPRADGMFPGALLARYHVIFDYPAGTFTIAQPGVLRPAGDSLPMPVGKESGYPRTELQIAGETFGFLIDTGASFTIVSDALLNKWKAAHADWPVQQGAAGEAATLGGATLQTIQLPGATWGTRTLPPFGMVSQREGVFVRNSRMMAAPIVGSLAGNVLKHFRVELDYPNQTLYLRADSTR